MVEQTALIKVIRRCVAGSSPVRSHLIMGSMAKLVAAIFRKMPSKRVGSNPTRTPNY